MQLVSFFLSFFVAWSPTPSEKFSSTLKIPQSMRLPFKFPFFFDMYTVWISCVGVGVGVVNLNGIASEGNRSYSSSSSAYSNKSSEAGSDRMG